MATEQIGEQMLCGSCGQKPHSTLSDCCPHCGAANYGQVKANYGHAADADGPSRDPASRYMLMVDQATTTALAAFAQLGDAAAEPAVAALHHIRDEAGLVVKEMEYATETITLPRGALRAIQRIQPQSEGAQHGDE